MSATLGLGTYRVRNLPEAVKSAVFHDVDWVDTAPVYLHGKAEQQLKPALATCPMSVSTKVGFFTPSQAERAFEEDALPHAQVSHCLTQRAILWQAERSRRELGRMPDITFVHNPEHGLHDIKELESRLYEAVAALEECVDRGLTKGYGVATWDAVHDGRLPVERIAGIAKEVGQGGGSRLKAIQLPLSVIHLAPLADAIRGYGPLMDAQAHGLDVFASAPLHGGELLDIIPASVAEELAPGASPLRVALGLVASAPGVTRVLLSASSPRHWADAAKATEDPLPDEHLKEIARAFSP
ncbi:aldo/keto reductase [Streptomyces sp. NPDC014733]|uniref:aldo/keto reductase n=1 Tax=Streptomyces sp. NPDC014733 TaxID=3364885 RepID=UPI003700A500